MTPSREWALNSVKGKVFVRSTAAEALRALADWFEPMQKERTLLAVTIEHDQDRVLVAAIWEEKPLTNGMMQRCGFFHSIPGS